MSVVIPIPIDTVEEQTEQPSLTYRLDLEHNRIVAVSYTHLRAHET